MRQRGYLRSPTSAGLISRNCHAAAVRVKCAGSHQTAECAKSRDTPARCALCQGPHTANYKGCPKSSSVKKGDVPAQPPEKAVPKPAQRPAPRKPEVPKVSAHPAEKVSIPMEVDTPQPSTSMTKPSYAAAVRKGTTKTIKIARTVNTKTPKKGKTCLFSRETSTPSTCHGTRGGRTPATSVYATTCWWTPPLSPPYSPHNGQPDVLDIVVMKDVAQLIVLNELSSDHNPVLLLLGQAAPEDEEPWTRQTVSWPAFAHHLSANIGPITASSKQQYAKSRSAYPTAYSTQPTPRVRSTTEPSSPGKSET
ncbi:hypothetical protein Trydic_g12022 [Trypoxylus dichotomus]